LYAGKQTEDGHLAERNVVYGSKMVESGVLGDGDSYKEILRACLFEFQGDCVRRYVETPVIQEFNRRVSLLNLHMRSLDSYDSLANTGGSEVEKINRLTHDEVIDLISYNGLSLSIYTHLISAYAILSDPKSIKRLVTHFHLTRRVFIQALSTLPSTSYDKKILFPLESLSMGSVGGVVRGFMSRFLSTDAIVFLGECFGKEEFIFDRVWEVRIQHIKRNILTKESPSSKMRFKRPNQVRANKLLKNLQVRVDDNVGLKGPFAKVYEGMYEGWKLSVRHLCGEDVKLPVRLVGYLDRHEWKGKEKAELMMECEKIVEEMIVLERAAVYRFLSEYPEVTAV